MIGDPTWTDWAVLLEFADEQGRSTVEPESLRRLVAAWSGPAPTWLYSPIRYALQVTVRATDPPAALAIAMSRWADARCHSRLPAWDVVRAEVLTSAELERELDAEERATGDTDALRAPASEQVVADELLRRALNDGVTGLPNREMFLDDLRRTLATPLSSSEVRAVVTVALHTAGERSQPPDNLLAEIGERLTSAVRRGDPVARLGVAEFAALVTLPLGDHTDRVAERIVHCVRAAGERHGRMLSPTVGVATAAIGDDPDELMAIAEFAMSASRTTGPECGRWPWPKVR